MDGEKEGGGVFPVGMSGKGGKVAHNPSIQILQQRGNSRLDTIPAI